MPRLTTAMIAALGLHVLLLMMILPEQLVVEPEIKGSGQVTVSIVRRQVSVSETIEEPIVEQEKVEPAEEAEQQVDTILQHKAEKSIPPPVEVLPSRKPEPVKEPALKEKSIVVAAKEKKVASNTISPEPVQELISEPLQDIPSSDDEAYSSEMESLRHPEPLEAVNRPPVYPSLARKRGWQGIVLLEVDVLSNGMVKNIQIKESSSYEMLDRKALDAVRKWLFSPGLEGGKPVPMKVIVPIHYLLQDN